MKSKYWLIELIPFILGSLFFHTAVNKIIDYDHLTWQINNQPFKDQLTPILAPTIPAAELLLSFLLIWPRTARIGLYGSAALLGTFTIYTALLSFNFYSSRSGLNATVSDYFSWPSQLLMNLSFLAMAIISLYHLKPKKNTKRPPLP